MKMIKVKSSNIESIGYNSRTFQLFVEFKATDRSPSNTFIYEDVSPSECEALMNADSIGKHFSSYIKAVKECWAHDRETAKENNGWISVNDELPEKSGAYWTFNGLEKPSVIQQRVHMYDAKYKQFNIDTVTHWMPLPESPTT